MADRHRNSRHGSYTDDEEEEEFFRQLRQQQTGGARMSPAVSFERELRYRRANAASTRDLTTSNALSNLQTSFEEQECLILQRIREQQDGIRRRMIELEEHEQRIIIRALSRNGSLSIGQTCRFAEVVLPLQSLSFPPEKVLPLSWTAEESDLNQHAGATGRESSVGIPRDEVASLPRSNAGRPKKRRIAHSKSRSPRDKRAREHGEVEASADPRPTGIPLAMPSDKNLLSSYQATIRQSLEFFLASKQDTESSQKGRKRKIRVGQVGLRCRYCAHLHPALQTNGACTFPRSKESIYMCAQNIALAHLVAPESRQQDACACMPGELRQAMIEMKANQSASAVGSDYWANKGCACNLREYKGALWLVE